MINTNKYETADGIITRVDNDPPDINSETTIGLVLGFTAGRVRIGSTIVTVVKGTVTLTTATTNYVEVSSAGVVSTNTSGFTAGRYPLWTIVTGAAYISSVTSHQELGVAVGPSEIAVRSTVATLTATGIVYIPAPNCPSVLSGIDIYVTTTITASDTDYWTASAVNAGAAGNGTTALLAAADTNTTKVAGGGVTAKVARALVLHGTAANLAFAAKNLLVLTMTKAASGANLVDFLVVARFAIGG